MSEGNSPTFTQQVDMSVFIEPLGGPMNPLNSLDRFPDAVYHKSPDTHFVRFMYSLLGPAGLGWIKKQYLEAKLTLYERGFNNFQIENYYGDPFSFGRILEESLPEDPEGLLTREEWDIIKSKNESYRNRAVTFFNAARVGPTPKGMELAAESGLNHSAFVWENYKSLFDANSDAPLGLPHYGRTTATEEFIVIPDQVASRSEQQIISFAEATATSGTFVLEFNGQRTTPLNFKASQFELEAALEALGNIGKDNVFVTGGPNPNPFIVTFTGQLSDQDVATLIPTSNILNNLKEPIPMYVRVLVGGVETITEIVHLSDEYQHNAQTAIDHLRPLNTLPTNGTGSGSRTRQAFGSIFASSSYVESIKYVTGAEGINWPKVDTTNWIETGIEKESKKIEGDLQAHYVSYHSIAEEKASSTHVGRYDVRASTNFEFLRNITDDSKVFNAANAVPGCASPMEITTNVENGELIPMIEGSVSAAVVEGQVTSVKTQAWWSSLEKVAPEEDSYVIDLGTTRIVNWLTFDLTRKPLYLRIEFDFLDAGEPQYRRITLWPLGGNELIYANGTTYEGQCIYSPTLPPWQTFKYFFHDNQQHNIATRYLRLTFIRPSPGEGRSEPFTERDNPIPYSIDMRNLRVGRYAGTIPTWSS